MIIKKAVIEACGSCNYKCDFCPHSIGSGREKSFKRMFNFQMFKRVLDELIDAGVEEIFLEGSGEPLMNKNIHLYIEEGTKRGLKMSFITNGSYLDSNKIKKIIDAGLHYIRISVIGYNKETYEQQMSLDNFDLVKQNTLNLINYIKQTNKQTIVGSYHLILDDSQIDYEIDQYRKNWIDDIPNIQSSIWKMHNWAGSLEDVNWRNGHKKRSCGRPFSPDIIIRAGGNDGQTGAVVPCCMVLGQDSKAVLGHVSNQSIKEIWNGEKYNELRKAHSEHRFDDIDYCKNCDMLYDTPETIVWSNFDSNYDVLTGGINVKEFRK